MAAGTVPGETDLQEPVLSQLALLRLRDVRTLGLSIVLNSVGMMGELVVLGWLALELTDSPFLVGVAMGARMVPLFFVGVPAGVLADRFPRRRVLVLTGAGQALTAAALGALTLAGALTFRHLLLLTFTAGIARGVEHAARQSYTHDVVGAARLVDGLAITGVAMRAGWLLGSLLIGGVIARAGSGGAYLVVAASFLAGAVALLLVSEPGAAARRAAGSLWDHVIGFAVVVRRDPVLPALMLLTAGAEILGFAHQALLPSLARDVLRVGPSGLGLMNAARSLGGILGLVAVSGRALGVGPSPVGARGGTTFLVVLAVFGASLVALGVAPHVGGLATVLVVLVVANGVGALADLLAQSLMQLAVPADLRGRAGGAWVVAIGLAPLGQLQIGALASAFTVSIALGTSGLGLVALAGLAAVAFPRLRRI